MKRLPRPFRTIAIIIFMVFIPIIGISLYFLGIHLPFVIFGIIYGLMTIFLLLGSKNDRENIVLRYALFLVPIVIIIGIVIGLLRTNLWDGILLGAIFAFIATLSIVIYSFIHSHYNEVRKQNKETMNKDTKIFKDTDECENQHDEQVLNACEEVLRDSSHSKVDNFILGEVFPWKDYAHPGDFVVPVLNEKSFDLVVSLPNCTAQEIDAVAHEDVSIYVMETELAPLMLFQFGTQLRVDSSLNILKMKKSYRTLWLDDKSSPQHIRVFLLEGTDATLLAIRLLSFDGIDYVKSLCVPQTRYLKEDIDAYLLSIQQQYNLNDIQHLAKRIFVIKNDIDLD